MSSRLAADSAARQHFLPESIPSLPRRSCAATPRGMNDSVCTSCLGVAFSEVEWTPSLGCFLTLECFDIEVIHVQFHVSPSCSVLLSKGCGQHVHAEDFGRCCRSAVPSRGKTRRPRRRLAGRSRNPSPYSSILPSMM